MVYSIHYTLISSSPFFKSSLTFIYVSKRFQLIPQNLWINISLTFKSIIISVKNMINQIIIVNLTKRKSIGRV